MLLATAAGCFGPAVPSNLPCSVDGSCPVDQRCNLTTRVCTGTTPDGGPTDSPGADVPFPDASTLPWTVTSMGLGSNNDEDPSITSDGLVLVFVRRFGTQNYQLFTSTRSGVMGAWSAPVEILELNTPYQETSPELSPDGLSMYFTSNRLGGAGGRDIYMTTRATRTSTWGMPARVVELSTSGDDVGIGLDPTGNAAVIDSDVQGGRDLFGSNRLMSIWQTPQPLSGINMTNREEGSPSVEANGTIYFHVRIGGNKYDIWSSILQPGGYVTAAIPELDGYGDPFVLGDGSLLLCARNGELFQATR